MYILGINGGFRQGNQDVSAVLVRDGYVVAAIEEERLSRIKFSAGRLPLLSIREVLKIGGISIKEIDIVSFHGSTWGNGFDAKLTSYFINHFGYCPDIKFYHHHDCHAASTYYASGFQEALIISLDSSGDGISIQIATGIEGHISVLHRDERPNSLGIFYSLLTQYCGFTKESDEYKLMGLSAYGRRNKMDFSWLIYFKDGKTYLNADYLIDLLPGQPSPHRDEMLFNKAFLQKMGEPRRLHGTELHEFYKDVAASAQQHFEHILLSIVEYYVQKTGLKKICMAGGAALNCVANQKVLNSDFVDAVYVQPASSDAGISLGAAWLSAVESNIVPFSPLDTYLGNSYNDDEIEEILRSCKIKFDKTESPEKEAAGLVADDKVIGWFQGCMEFGPRALGNRSILANPCNPAIQGIVNKKIKLREGFRPFCPSILEEDVALYFSGKQLSSPYMTITYKATEFAKRNIPGVLHKDETARVQTVNKRQNEIFYKFLVELKNINGHGVVLNTSFNLSHEPIVCSPRDALSTFYSSGLDALIIGNYIIEKNAF